MHKTESTVKCGADCSQCPVADETEAASGTYSGGRLAMVAGAYFLGPLVLAFAGVIAGGPSPLGQLVGGTAGLGAGLITAVAAARYGAGARESTP